MLYKYVGTGHAEDDIERLKQFVEDGTIFASDPRTFNDPAELKVIVDFKADHEAMKAKYQEDPEGKSFEDYCKQYLTMSPKLSTVYSHQIRNSFLSSAGVFCTTFDCQNYLLWSHYAKHHSGFCIGFDEKIKTIPDESLLFSRPVSYQSILPTIKYFYDHPEQVADAVLFTKSDIWTYEKEYRIVFDGSKPVDFDKSLVKEIILGCKAPRELTQYVREIIGTHIEVYQMVDSLEKYSLEKKKLDEVDKAPALIL